MRCHLHHGNLLRMKINLAGSLLRNLKKANISQIRKSLQRISHWQSGSHSWTPPWGGETWHASGEPGPGFPSKQAHLSLKNKVIVLFSERLSGLKGPYLSGTCHLPLITAIKWAREKNTYFNDNSNTKWKGT